MDDYFYPYPENGQDFPDNDTYSYYLSHGGRLTKGNWRRENINQMVQSLQSHIHGKRPNVTFTVSPFGLYRPQTPEGMPYPITGFDPYASQYSDTKLWLQKGWVDILAPQQSWPIGSPPQSYTTLLDWWVKQNTAKRLIAIGNSVTRLNPHGDDWPVTEVGTQVDMTRCYRDQNAIGAIFFSAKVFLNDTKGIREYLRKSVYPNKATVPSLPWKSLPAANKPQRLRLRGSTLVWDKDDQVMISCL